MCRKLAARFGFDQPKGQARLPARSANEAGQAVLCRSRMACHGNTGSCQRGRKLAGNAAGEYGVPLQGLRWRLAIAMAVLDGEPPEMRKATAQRDVGDLRAKLTSE